MTSLSKLLGALNAVQRDCGGYVQKDGENTFHRYKYASEDGLLTVLRPAMVQHGLILIPSVAVEPGPWQDEHGNSHLIMEYTLAHTSGEVWPQPIRVPGCGNDRHKNGTVGDKGMYKAMTGANKYALFKLFQIATGDDPERVNAMEKAGNGADVTKPKAKAKPKAAPKNAPQAKTEPPPPRPDDYPEGLDPVAGFRLAHETQKHDYPRRSKSGLWDKIDTCGRQCFGVQNWLRNHCGHHKRDDVRGAVTEDGLNIEALTETHLKRILAKFADYSAGWGSVYRQWTAEYPAIVMQVDDTKHLYLSDAQMQAIKSNGLEGVEFREMVEG